ncbi:MAG: TraX family protein [Lachnospiraceae bacterium]|nr:TraX family protein [Lachnospiraceae bacterium]
MSGSTLKIIALITMTIDHIGYWIFPSVIELRIIGRLSYPIFAYMIAEGCYYTRDKIRYLMTVFGIGLLCSIVEYITQRSLYQSIFITFSISIVLIIQLDFIKRAVYCKNRLRMAIALMGFLLTIFIVYFLCNISNYYPKSGFEIDFGFFGILTPVLVWAVKDKKIKLLFLAIGLILLSYTRGGIQLYSFLSLIPLMYYNGERGRHKLKYMFYLYYPLHLVILSGIASII